MRAEPARRKVRQAARAGEIEGAGEAAQAEAAVEKGIIDTMERDLMAEATAARLDTIQVDAFDPETYNTLKG